MPPDRVVHLQGIGLHKAVSAAELVAGDVTVWNYGGTELILSVERLSPKFLRINSVTVHPITGERGDRVWARRLKDERLIAVSR